MDVRQLEQIMAQYSAMMLKVAFIYVKDRQVAEDIVQEVFIQLFYDKRYEERGQIKAYIMTLTINRCKNYLKSWSYRMIHFKQHWQEKVAHKRNGVIVAEEKSALQQALWQLPVPYREVLYFTYYEQQKGADVATLLGIPESTVKTRLRRGKQLLRAQLMEDEWELLKAELAD